MICPNCKRELPDDTKFCGGCGTRMMPPVQPPVEQPVQFTETVFEQPVQFTEPVFEQPVFTQPEVPAAPGSKQKGNVLDMFKKIPGKYLKLGGIIAAVLVVAIVALCLIPGGNSGTSNGSGYPEGALYLKDGELYYSDYSKKAPYEITGNLLENASNYDLWSYSYEISNTIHVTEDGKTMFYMDKLSYDGTGTLYSMNLDKMSQEPVKISAGVTRYTVSKDGKLITFLKGDVLYQYNMKEETKIGKDVSNYRVSEDGKIIYFRNYDGAWYVVKNGEDEKIGNDISIEYITDDYSTVYYMNDDKLYKKTIGKDKEKLLSGIEVISSIDEDGTFYYCEYNEMPLADFFKMDTDEYGDVLSYLEGESLEFYDIGYYNGKEGTIIAENCGDYEMDGSAMLYWQYAVDSVSSIPVSELVTYYYDSSYYYVADAAEQMVNEQLMDSETVNFAMNGTVSILELENIDDLAISEDGTTMYVLCDVDYGSGEGAVSEENYKPATYEGTLYKVTISNDKIKSVDEFDDAVYSERGGYFANYNGEYSDYYVYFKDVKDNHGDLYANGVLVESDVYVRNSVRYCADSNGLIYYVDYDNEDEVGALMVWNGKESVEIHDEAYAFEILESGDILVGSDYKDESFTLSIWDGKKLTEISDDAYTCAELDSGDLLVGTDYSSKNDSYTMNLWNGKELKEISEDVYDYAVMPDGDIFYLYDYSTSKNEGELYLWNGKKAVMVDEDVAAVIYLPGTVTHYFD